MTKGGWGVLLRDELVGVGLTGDGGGANPVSLKTKNRPSNDEILYSKQFS